MKYLGQTKRDEVFISDNEKIFDVWFEITEKKVADLLDNDRRVTRDNFRKEFNRRVEQIIP